MYVVLMSIAGIFSIASFVGAILIIIEAFKDEIWKGAVSILCGLYLIYYALFEYDPDNKWVGLGLFFGCGLMATFLKFLAVR